MASSRANTVTRRAFIAGSAGLGALALAGCGQTAHGDSAGGTGDAAGADTSQVVVTLTKEAEPAKGFDPLYAWGDGEHVHEPLIQSTLFVTDAEMNFVNDLATSYESSGDGLTWTFHIRDDVKFTDGEPLTASDVAFTVNGIIGNDAAEADLTMVDGAEATDSTTCVLHLNKPYNAILYTLAVVGIVPEHAYGPDYGEHPIGSGRYMLEQWDKGQQVILKANPDYYGEPAKMERVVVLFIDETASLAAAKAKEADLAYTAATYADQVPEGFKLLNAKSVDSRGISLPTQPEGSPSKQDGDVSYAVGNAITSDVAVRRAMNLACDRDAAVRAVLNGYGDATYSVSQGMPWISEDMQCAYDPEEAKRLLDEAGWVADDGIPERRAKDGRPLALTLWYTAGDSVRQALATQFAQQMGEIGMEIEVSGASFEDIYPHQYTDPVLWGWGSNSPSEYYNLYYATGWGNFPCYENATLDGYMDEALAQPTVDDSYEYWKESQWDGTEGICPKGASTWVWICNVDHLYFQRDGLEVAPQKPHPHGHGWSILNNVDQWTWAAAGS